ncbi:MAG: hypothetical protein ILA19_02960 [Bacilli bacterium]|nr:hypothetical protein [Bacilli bacterium]
MELASFIISTFTLLILLGQLVFKGTMHKAYNDTNNEYIGFVDRTIEDIDNNELPCNCIINSNDEYTMVIKIYSNKLIRRIKVYMRSMNGDIDIIGRSKNYYSENFGNYIENIKPNEKAYIACHLPAGPGQELIIEIERFDYCIVKHSVDMSSINASKFISTEYKNRIKHFIYYFTS